MEYVQPYGISDPDAPYINGDPSIGRQGSIPPAAAFEHPMREIVGVIEKSNIVPSDEDLLQMAKGVRSQAMNFCEDTGSVNTLSVALDPPLGAYTLGLLLRVRVNATNTGASTIDAGAGRVAIKRPDGGNMAAGDLPGGGIVDLAFDGTAFQTVNYLGGATTSGDVINNFQNVPYVVDTSPTPNIITANFAPPITVIVAGTLFIVKIANTNTGVTTIVVNGVTKTVKTNSGGDLLPGDVIAGDIKLFAFDGTNFFIEPNPSIPVSVTLNVPSAQYPDVANTLNQIARKAIARTATVKIKLAAGIYPPIYMNHRDGANIVIEGTMLGAAPVDATFAKTGNTPAARAADAATNIVMLRSRYGTEIQVPLGSAGFANLGPGSTHLKDVLIVGLTKAMQTNGVSSDHYMPLGTVSVLENVAIWGCTFGIFCGGQIVTQGGSCSNCYDGVNALHGAQFEGHTMVLCGNDGNGVVSQHGSSTAIKFSQIKVNGIYGGFCHAASFLNLQECTVTSNATSDLRAQTVGNIVLRATAATTFSPPLGVVGNSNSLIVVG